MIACETQEGWQKVAYPSIVLYLNTYRKNSWHEKIRIHKHHKKTTEAIFSSYTCIHAKTYNTIVVVISACMKQNLMTLKGYLYLRDSNSESWA